MKYLLIILGLLIPLALVAGFPELDSGEKKSDPDRDWIPEYIVDRIRGAHHFSVEELPRYEVEDLHQFFKEVTVEPFITFTMEPPRGMMDGFTHRVYINSEDGTFWVFRSGVFAGVFEIYGPGTPPAEPGEGDNSE